MNAQQVSTELGVTERTVRRWIQAGLLPARKERGQFVIDLEVARRLVTPRADAVFNELEELRGYRERYEELERRYDQLLRLLDPHHALVPADRDTA